MVGRVSGHSREVHDDESWRRRASRHHHAGVLLSSICGDVPDDKHLFLTPVEWRLAMDLPTTTRARHREARARLADMTEGWPAEAADVLRQQDVADAACMAALGYHRLVRPRFELAAK